ncbi:RNA polymerase sigma factor [Govanella unica]|uniref:RNA polymerase sigma factor n=1 Tax=Govanella unica TaxID=2975056 RepID=A0A9X3Z7Q6_9PROT|nr:RNA polymerase sigma factor [Govania unica]MDA5194432.1 RNA polymerase sigma factor [Govania unica]
MAHGGIVDSLHRSYAEPLQRFLRRVLDNEQDAADTAQEAYLRLWRQECQGRLRQKARSYLFETAANLVRDRRRADRVRATAHHVTLEDGKHPANLPLADDVLHWRQKVNAMKESLMVLPTLTRAVFLAYHVDQHSYQKIAADFKVTTRTVERHMSRALAHCKMHLKDFE